MGAAVPVVGAVTGVVSSIAGISAKNKQAAAERQQLQAQQYQQAVQSAATQASLTAQQELARSEYQLGVISRLQNYSTAKAGLVAQEAMAAMAKQNEQFQIQANSLQGAGQLAQQQAGLERQALGVQVATDQQLGQSAQRQIGVSEQLTAQLAQQAAGLSEQQRRRISEAAAGRIATSSSRLAREGQDMKTLAKVFSDALSLDQTQTLSVLQGLNEEQLALISEQIGLNDTQAGMDTVTNNLKLAALGAQQALSTSQGNFDNTVSALQGAGSNLDFSNSVQAQAAKDAYAAQDFSLGVQRGMNAQTSSSVQSNYANAISNVRGAGFADYLNAGVNAFGSVSPLLRGSASLNTGANTTSNVNSIGGTGLGLSAFPTAPMNQLGGVPIGVPTYYSGYPNSLNNYG